MKTIKELTPDQYNLLSWFATFVYNLYMLKDRKIDMYEQGKLQGIQSACTFANIPDELLYKIEIDKQFTGLRNWNKISEIVIFE
jgi:hypothetical protein